MITYRSHKGSLSDSMKDKKKFNTLQDLLEYIVEDHNTEIPYFQICIDDLSIKMYGDGGDKRVGWKDLFVICYESYDRIADKIGYDRYFDGEHYDHPCGVIGFFTTAQPERPRGEWIKEREEWFTDYPYKCTNCGKYSRARYHFCPNCGADMRGEQDGSNS